MTNTEIVKKWEEIFILIMEETDNPAYKRAEEVISRDTNQKELAKLLEDELPLGIVIGFYIILMILESSGADKLTNVDIYEMAGRIDDFWNRYLRKPTRAFTSKNGLAPVDTESLHVSCKIIARERSDD